MSILFTSSNIGKLELKNRFINSATYENMAEESGKVNEQLVNRYRRMAKGEVGLIIPGFIFVHSSGKAAPLQMGIHSDEMIPGLKKLVDAIHQNGSKVVFQLMHAGRQTKKALIGQTPAGPSKMGRDPNNMVKCVAMTEEQILEAINAFGKAAKRSVEAGADGVQLHSAHGYLISQFLSPFFNQRADQWGGSDENRFRFISEIVRKVKKELPEGKALMVKMNTNDFTPEEGVTPPLAAKYARWLSKIGVDAVELSSGTTFYSAFNMCRGEVPVKEIVSPMPWLMRPLVKMKLKGEVGNYNYEEPYNLDTAEKIKPEIGDVKLCLVGGLRSKSQMEDILEKGHADFISMSRPFIREPAIVKKLHEGKTEDVSCESCNRCLASSAAGLPLKCYNKGFPSK